MNKKEYMRPTYRVVALVHKHCLLETSPFTKENTKSAKTIDDGGYLE